MKKISFFLSAFTIIALLQPLSVEAKTVNTFVLEEVVSQETKTTLTLRGKDSDWIFQAGFLRLRPKKESLFDRALEYHQWREPAHGVGIAFAIKF